MNASYELERLNWNIAGLEAQSMLARVCVPAPKPVATTPLIDRRWFMACVYVVVAMVIGAAISMVIA
jgi:hypothetical protein